MMFFLSIEINCDCILVHNTLCIFNYIDDSRGHIMSEVAEKVIVAAEKNEEFPEELSRLSIDDLNTRSRLLDNDLRVMKSEIIRLQHEQASMMEQLQDNMEKIKLNKQLPYLVANIVELLEVEEEEADEEEEEEELGTNDNNNNSNKNKNKKKDLIKCAVVKTTTRTTSFLPLIGLVDSETLKPGDLVGVNKDSFLVLDTLPSEYDSRVKAMEVDERPTEDYGDVGGLDKQIEELVEAVVLPMTQPERFKKLGIKPPKGVIMYGPPGTGKTLLARACAAQTKSIFLKLAGPQLVQVNSSVRNPFSFIYSFIRLFACFRCTLVMVPNWLGMLLLWQKKRHLPSFLLMNWMLLGQNVSIPILLEIVKYREQCLNFSTNWMASVLMIGSK